MTTKRPTKRQAEAPEPEKGESPARPRNARLAYFRAQFRRFKGQRPLSWVRDEMRTLGYSPSPGAVGKWHRGEAFPSWEWAPALCQIFRCSERDLVPLMRLEEAERRLPPPEEEAAYDGDGDGDGQGDE